jgi:hypothetical protein
VPTLEGWTEADVTINGAALSFAEAMTLRVAVGSFRIWLSDRAVRDGLGEPLASNYDARLVAIERLMMRSDVR